MSIADIIILIVVVVLLSLIIFFSFIKPKLKKESPCCRCAYAKQCEEKNNKCESFKKEKLS